MVKKHSVLLKEEKCVGCTNCVKNCPTKAIRVHQGKAMIKGELCIDCAECIRTCAYHAKYTETAGLEDLAAYPYPVALVPPSFYGQFEQTDPDRVVAALYQLGFKGVYDVARAAEAVSLQTIEFLNEHEGMYISSSCPGVVRLIKIIYPELLADLIPFKSPVELMAERVRQELEQQGVAPGDMGLFFFTPCPAKLTTITNPLGMERSYLDQAIAVEKVYPAVIKQLNQEQLTGVAGDGPVPFLGISWGQSGGETTILKRKKTNGILSVSGIHNVKRVLDEIDRNNIKGIKYLELSACSQGCVGGILNVLNPFQAKYNLQRLSSGNQQLVERNTGKYNFRLSRKFKAGDVGKLADDFDLALAKLAQLEEEIKVLPGLDCAACGAPDCETLAEDIVSGRAQRTDCIFVLREQVGKLADRMSELAHALPPVMKKKKGDQK